TSTGVSPAPDDSVTVIFTTGPCGSTSSTINRAHPSCRKLLPRTLRISGSCSSVLTKQEYRLCSRVPDLVDETTLDGVSVSHRYGIVGARESCCPTPPPRDATAQLYRVP